MNPVPRPLLESLPMPRPTDDQPRPRAATGRAHAKGILVGEHAVVYGHPAVALPITPLQTVAEVHHSPGPLRLRFDGHSLSLPELPERFTSVGIAASAAFDHFGLSDADLEIEVRSDIPARAGLGASAAAAHAIIEAVRAHADQPLDEASRFALVQAAERVAHGNASGLDAHATRARTPLVFADGATTPLSVGRTAWFAIADTGHRASTAEAVAAVRHLVDTEPRRGAALLERLGELAGDVVGDLREGRLVELGERLTAAQEALDALGVGHESIDRLVTAAVGAGSPGAKLTGAGRGGCVIAAATGDDEARAALEAMTAAGAVGGWILAVEET